MGRYTDPVSSLVKICTLLFQLAAEGLGFGIVVEPAAKLAEKVVPGPGNHDALVGCVKAQIYTYRAPVLLGGPGGPNPDIIHNVFIQYVRDTPIACIHMYVGDEGCLGEVL